MTLKQFYYVLTISNAGGFARAADMLNISQPSLSQYIKKIEKQLGVELFERIGGSVRLTDAGRVYIDAGRQILDIERRMVGQINDLTEHKTGTIMIGTSPYRSASMMPIIAKKFQEKYPGMHLVVEEMTSQELTEAAERGQFDLCLTMRPINERLFNCEKIADEELIVAVPAAYPILSGISMQNRKYSAVDISEFKDQPFVMIKEGQWMQQALENLMFDQGVSLKKASIVKSLEAQIAMVRAGVGVALMPSGIERFCSSNEVRFYSLRQELAKREVVVIWRKERALNLVTKELLDIIKTISW